MSRYAELADVPHYVYRAFDANGRVIYVGCTHDFEARKRQHASGIGRRAVRWDCSRPYPDRKTALRVEGALIFFHQPPCNSSGKNREPYIEIPPEARLERIPSPALMAQMQAAVGLLGTDP